MASRFRDFDAAIAALDPITFMAQGKRYTLEEPPAATILRLIEEDILNNPQEVPTLLRELIGKDNYESLMSDGVSLTQMLMITQWIAEQCGIESGPSEGSPSNDGVGGGSPSP